eukprot:4073457-Alexandrium_andersonii.AAC.1
MSASLVGSEMCIRDSSTRNANVNPQMQKSLQAFEPGTARAHGRPQSRSCLLYTSDAADDM